MAKGIKAVKDWGCRSSAAAGRGLLYTYLTVMYRPKVYYRSRAAAKQIKEGGLILIANHVGHNDGQMFYMKFKNSALLVAKDWADKALLRWITKGGMFIPIDREGMDISWVRETAEYIKQGHNVIIFPEGHTSRQELDTFKPGFALLSVMTGAKVVPIYNDGQYHKLFGRRLRLYVGEPTELSGEKRGLSADYLNAESTRFKDMINQMKRGTKNG